MKSLRITLLFIVLSSSAIAKDSTTVEFKRFALGIHGSPDYCFRSLSSIVYSTLWRDAFEKPMLGYTGGIDLSYFIKKQFAVSLGVNYSQKGYGSHEINIAYAYSPETIIGTGKYRYNYNYIEIPVKANFVFGKNKIRFITSLGASPAFMLYQRTNLKIKYIDDTRENKKGKPNYIYNPFNLFLNGSIGIDCKLGKKMGLRIEPTYSYGLFETINASYSEHLWNAGLNIGCYIKL